MKVSPDSGKNTVAKQLLSNFIDQWKACMDKVDAVGTLFIDFRKSFNVVDHQTLIRSFKCINLVPTQLNGSNPILNVASKPRTIWSTPRLNSGSTRFSQFINDLPVVLQYCKADLYADDATFHTQGNNKNEIHNDIQSHFMYDLRNRTTS